MKMLTSFLVIALVASALWLVHVQYESRRLVGALEKARAQGAALTVQTQRLEVDKHKLEASARIESEAENRLSMQGVSPGVTQYVLDAKDVKAGVN